MQLNGEFHSVWLSAEGFALTENSRYDGACVGCIKPCGLAYSQGNHRRSSQSVNDEAV